jgi:hypothetical protein
VIDGVLRCDAHTSDEPVTPDLVEGLIRDALGDPTVVLALAARDRAGSADAPEVKDREYPRDFGGSGDSDHSPRETVGAAVHDRGGGRGHRDRGGLAATSLMGGDGIASGRGPGNSATGQHAK